ncbi:phage virion morphogenesis protein [Actinobacillus equuli subsp. haemolyticus]|uniref:Phage virion morphogenesis protein n=1 Tax=Actinobacillus equuli subsp. equuli TaxID=202947 RepID=A0A9X4JC61_ACTEU|nr:phage virion morphogenesis protein [Actinobacillus equuli]MDE8034646.1 phage virion morphogenesis protein [Actinobacillus equuli subsp. equuli]WGE63791.1 phage virion morphogenesis protein [Actinobacillus equuli subsp. haemolyticus]
MTTVAELNNYLEALVGNLTPAKRKTLIQEIGRKLAESQRKRIREQKNPDGSNYVPRRKPVHKTKRRVNKAMFSKLSTARLMKTKGTKNGVEIGYSGANAVIADVHQYGKPSHVVKNANWKVQYEQRELLGFTDEDIEMIEDCVINVLRDGL